jgi:hypothetical protein
MPLLLELRDQTFLIKTGFFRDTNSLHLDALDDWTWQRLPVSPGRAVFSTKFFPHGLP